MNSTFFVSIVQACDLLGGASSDSRGIIWIQLIKVHKEMLCTKYESSTPSFREEVFWSLPSWFLCSNLWPQGQGQFDPRGIICTNLAEVHKEMLHTKYQNSMASSFREKEFWRWASLFLCSNLWPQVGTSFDPRGIICTNLVEVHQKMLHTKYQSSSPYGLGQEDFYKFCSLSLCEIQDPTT